MPTFPFLVFRPGRPFTPIQGRKLFLLPLMSSGSRNGNLQNIDHHQMTLLSPKYVCTCVFVPVVCGRPPHGTTSGDSAANISYFGIIFCFWQRNFSGNIFCANNNKFLAMQFFWQRNLSGNIFCAIIWLPVDLWFLYIRNNAVFCPVRTILLMMAAKKLTPNHSSLS